MSFLLSKIINFFDFSSSVLGRERINSRFSLKTLEQTALTVFQAEKKADKNFVSLLFQALNQPQVNQVDQANWLNEAHIPLLRKAVSILGPDDMVLLEVQHVLQVIEKKQLFARQPFELNTLLVGAIQENNLELVKQWIEMGAQVNGNNNEQQVAPLMLACCCFSRKSMSSKEIKRLFEIIQFLLDHRANTCIRGVLKTPFHIAIESENEELLNLLLKGHDSTQALKLRDYRQILPIHCAAQLKSLILFNRLKEVGSPIECDFAWNFPCTHSFEKSILVSLCKRGEFEVVNTVIRQAIEKNSLHDLEHLPCLLYWTIVYGDEKLAILLMNNGVRNSFRDAEECSALFFAQMTRRSQVVIDQLQLHDPDPLFVEEQVISKRVSHYLKLKGVIKIKNQSITLTGAKTEYMSHTIAESLQAYRKVFFSKKETLLKPEDFDVMIRLFQQLSKQSSFQTSPQEIFDSVTKEPITLVSAEIKRHGMLLAFFRDNNDVEYMALIDRKQSSRSNTLQVWKVMFKSLTLPLIQKIQKQKFVEQKDGYEFFHDTLPRDLSISPYLDLVRDESCKAFSDLACLSQKVGNCSLAALLGAIPLIMAVLYMRRYHHPLTQILVEQVKQEKKIWNLFAQCYNAHHYLKIHRAENGNELADLVKKQMNVIHKRKREKQVPCLHCLSKHSIP